VVKPFLASLIWALSRTERAAVPLDYHAPAGHRPQRGMVREGVKLPRIALSVCGMISLSGSLPERKGSPRETAVAARRYARGRRLWSVRRPRVLAWLRREGRVRAVALRVLFQD
jgi:hypothetical protein